MDAGEFTQFKLLAEIKRLRKEKDRLPHTKLNQGKYINARKENGGDSDEVKRLR